MALAGNDPGQTVLLDFYADWCHPCQLMMPTVEQLAAKGYPVRRMNVDQYRDLLLQVQRGTAGAVAALPAAELESLLPQHGVDRLKDALRLLLALRQAGVWGAFRDYVRGDAVLEILGHDAGGEHRAMHRVHAGSGDQPEIHQVAVAPATVAL